MGLAAFVAAPAVVRAASIIRVQGIDPLILPKDQAARDVVSFTIYGWDKLGSADFHGSSPEAFENPPIAIRLSPTWRLGC
jgi:hypothetical protein